MGNLNRERLGLLQTMCPRLFDEPGTLLYIGAYERRFFGSLPLYQAGNEITVLEAWPPFLEGLMESRWRGRVAHAVVGDVTALDEAPLPYDRFDHVCWFHGPEHVEKAEGANAIRALWQYTRNTLVVSCPWGRFAHGVFHGNPYTRHLSHWYPEDLEAIGLRTACIGPVDHPGNQLQGWRVRR